MQATSEELSKILVFAALEPPELKQLQPYSTVQNYQQGEILMQEGDRLPTKLYTLLSGSLRITKTTATGKETIAVVRLRCLMKMRWMRSLAAH